MSPARSVRFQRPPPPCVEEESASLARELHGSMKLGEKPGVEGTRTRGAVDQYPVIVTLDSSPSSTPFDDPSMPGMGNFSSDDSTGPRTPPPRMPEAIVRTRSESQSTNRSRSGSSVSSSNSRGRPPQVHQQPTTTVRQPRPPSHVREIVPARGEDPAYITPHRSGRSRSRGPGYRTRYQYSVKAPLARSNSTRHSASTIRPASSRSRAESSGYLSDSATTRTRPVSHYASPSSSTPGKPMAALPAGVPTLAERIEEKLRQRQAVRESGSLSDSETRTRSNKTKSFYSHAAAPASLSKPFAPSQELQRTSSTRSRERRLSRAGPPPPAPPASPRSASRARSGSRSNSADDVPVSSSQPPRRAGSVKFKDESPQRGNSSQPSAGRATSTPPRPSGPNGLFITPCPRSIATGGHQDWSTLKGLTHLDICPSCMSQIGTSRFRDFFIPSLPKLPNQKTRCAFANAWARLAWTQMVKKKHDSLEMLYQMTRPPPGARPCSGRILTDQPWHRIVDPETGMYLPRFHICSSCARNVRVLMPAHRDTFQPCPEPQERVCDFVTTSPRFIQFIDLLDSAAARAEADATRRPDPREFLAYARRKVVLRDCRRDRPTLGTWHYIPSMPEFSVCEDCYDEVVWPLAKSHHPIARMFSTSMRLLPGDGPNRCREASCQLYSGRMRARFRDAVAKDDLSSLRSVALRRFEAERRFKDRREELAVSEKKGYDCSEEVRKAIEEWRRWE
ncbi:hypothetical protein N7492_006082 [Penicillium capsulatum]|uniref:Uncharacterized protein n=1 Tax=Penicillium capsulatum TaxID=69766 RepID=A0A9W9I0V9_9EURO|nr:hypothetical protein N7492_006082 [Penicillium capsulatum]